MTLPWYIVLEKLQDFLFPLRTCALCQKEGKYDSQNPWCSDCEAQRIAEMQEAKLCAICQRGIPETQKLCSFCFHQRPAFSKAMHLAPYGGKIKAAIKALKYHNQKVLAHKLGHLLAEKIQEDPDFSSCEVVVPVPLFPQKQRERGFNQSALLAQQIARENGWETDFHTLIRIRNTPSQTTLNQQERKENVHQAFQVVSDRLRGKTVLLVDDVFTTGATVGECAEALLQNGSTRVFVITLAAVGQSKEDKKKDN